MPTIRPSADLRNNYAEISEMCHNHNEPVFITKNGKGDLAVMSIEAYEQICSKHELYTLLEEGLRAEAVGDIMSIDDVITDIREKLKL